MKKLVFYGDGLLCPPHGYSEQFVDLLVFHRPGASFQSFHLGEETLSLEAAGKGLAFHVIGKAPDLIYLGLGQPDLLAGVTVDTMWTQLEALLHLLGQKTQAQIAFTPLCEAFYPDSTQREQAHRYNERLPSFASSRVHFLDVNSPVQAFLEQHRQGIGEKRALHLQPLRLTSMGRVFLAQTAFNLATQMNLFTGID